MKTITKLWTVLAASLLFVSVAFGQDVLSQAKQLLAQRNAQAAFELLKPLEDKRAGDPDYDYLLGISALDSGKLTEAVFAFERVLAVKPDHPQARAEIARAYFQLGELETSRREFQSVQKAGPPPQAASTIQKFLDAIDQAQASTRTTIAAYVEASVGHDSNVNSGTGATSTPAVPGIGPGVIAPSAREQDDAFATIAAGVNVRHPVNPTTALIAGVTGSQRFLSSKTEYEQGDINLNLGVEFNDAPNKFSVAVQGQQLYYDWNRLRDTLGVIGQWQRQIGQDGVFSAFLQYAQLEYKGQPVNRDADRKVGGIAYAHAFSAPYQPVAFGSLYYGHEDEDNGARPDFGHRLWGARLGGQITVREGLTAFAFGSYEERDYGGPFGGPLAPFTGTTANRADKQADLRVGVSYSPSKPWTITPQVVYTDNRSNSVFTDFERTQVLVTVRRDFK